MCVKHIDIKRNSEIDLLRAYSVILIFILHYCLIMNEIFDLTIPIRNYINLEVGVDIFFVISGYVVAESFSRINSRNPKSATSTFLKKRIKRLWPASAFWLFVCFISCVVFKETGFWPNYQKSLYQFLYGLVYLFNFQEIYQPTILGYFWSLSLEFQVYLCLPFLFCISRKNRIYFIIILFSIGLFYRPGESNWWMFRYDGVLIGILIFELFSNNTFLKFHRKNKIKINYLSILLIMTILIVEPNIKNDFLGKSLVTILAGFLLLLALFEKGFIHNLKLRKLLNWIGTRSYSIYLSHIPITLITISIFEEKYIHYFYIFIPLNIFLIYLLSELSYSSLEIFERPFLKKNNRHTLTSP